MAYLFVVGFVSILGQVVLLRELNVAFYGVELVYSLALGMWLLCTAAGTWISGGSGNPSQSRIGLLLSLFGVLLPLDVAYIRGLRVLFAAVPGAYLPFQTQILAMFLSLFPLGIVIGLLFRWAAARFMADGRSLALAYALECAGGMAGGLCATLLLRYGLQNFTIALICSSVSMVLPLAGAFSARGRLMRLLWSLPAICLAWCFLRAQILDFRMTSWTHPNLAETRDSPYSRLTVTQLGGQVSVFENDALSFETEGTEAEEFVHLTALQHPKPSRVLILGGGMEGLVREMLKHQPDRIDYVELNPVYLKVVGSHLPAEFTESTHAPGVRILAGEPRRVLSSAVKYDLILVGMPEPGSGQSNRFYTQDFYRQCRNRLNPGGLVGFRLISSENYWSPQLTQRMVSIYGAARSVFSDVMVLPGSTNVVVASRERLPRDPEVAAQRFRQREIQARLVSPAYIRYLYRNDRFSQISSVLENGSAPVNTDARPICYQYTLMLWLSKFFPSMARLDFSGISLRGLRPGLGVWLALAVVLFLFLLGRKRGLRRVLLMGMTGLLGMVTETLLILHYQVKNGILFQDLGVLLMSFMAGMTAGATALDLWACSRPGAKRRAAATAGLVLVLGFVPLAAWMTYRNSSGAGMGLLETSLLLAVSGFLVAGIFAAASLPDESDARELIAPLYSADLIGSCIGSLTATLFVIPVFGLAATSAWMLPLALLTAVLV